MKIKIAIADSNEIYAGRLFEALQLRDNLALSVFTDHDTLKRELSMSRYDIMLIDYSMYSDELSLKNVNLPVILFDEDNIQSGSLLKKYKSVKKYQRSSTIYKEVLGFYSEIISNMNPLGASLNNHSIIICFTSPIGGSGKTTAALAAANSIANRGRSVMYLNFEPIASYGAVMNLRGGKGMGELFAALESKANFPMKLESLTQKTPQGVTYFERFENLFDIYEITREDIEKLLRAAAESGTAEYIIIDSGSELNPLNRAIMDMADKIVLLERHDPFGVEKLKAFAAHRTVSRDYSDKILSIINFTSDSNRKSAAGYEIIGRIAEKKVGPGDVISYISRNSLIDIDRIIS